MVPFFSILVPVFNQNGKIDECIASLKNQSFKDLEVIFVDDGSDDGSFEMLCTYASEDSRFHVYRHDENLSLAAARITGMSHASGRYVLFLDSDDFLIPCACECLHASLKEHPVDLMYFGFRRDPSGQRLLPQKTDNLTLAVLTGQTAPAVWKNCCRASVIKKALERISPFYCNMGEDTFFSVVLSVCAESYGTLDEVIYVHNEGGMSSFSSIFAPEKLRKSIASAESSGENTVRFLEQYAPEYLPYARKAAERILRYILYQHAVNEDDWCNIYEVLQFFNTGKYRHIFNWGCEELLKLKVLRECGKTIMVNFDLTFEEAEK